MWQFVIVYTIGILVAALLLYRIYRFFFVKRGRPNPCAGCSGCALAEHLK
ncbi:MAG: FeoB-associated Cys-rich membrane protein [Dysgonamonadaceae bacterium]|jgi:hypothetical protein|nr:FeoB-associated Cys-rich membrane protein [Dysgonamonadaceae bacterium]